MQPLEGYQLEREGSHAVALDLGARRRAAPRGPRARGRPCRAERAQGARGWTVEDRIGLVLGGDDELLGAARAHQAYVAGEVLAVDVAYDGAGDGQSATVKGRELRIVVARA